MVSMDLLLDGVLVGTVELDASGYASGNLLVDVGATGTHVLTAQRGDYATVTSGTGTGTFEVVALFQPPTSPSGSVPAYTPPPVSRWQFQDPVTADVYDFPINPTTTGIPVPPRPVGERATTTGVPISHEGASQPFEWTFNGSVLTEANYDAFRSWAARKYRIWVTDDLGRRYQVQLTDFAHSPAKPSQGQRGLFFGTYVMKATVFEVVDP